MNRNFGVWKMWAALGIALACSFHLVLDCSGLNQGRPVPGEPWQDDSAKKAAFVHLGYRITPFAQFEVTARLLSKERYRWDPVAKLAPLDFALGWNRMSEDEVLAQLKISQGNRFYFYRWSREPPIPPPEMIRSSANIHLVPASEEIYQQLDAVNQHAKVRLSGWLIDVDGDDGGQWRSSRRRDDTGAGACEILWVESVTVEN